jgi:hypothetical protein
MPTGQGLLAALAGLGPHFALEQHPPDAAPAGDWRPFDELLATLDVRVAEVRAALAAASGRAQPDEVELRVAVSMTQLGLTGRLVGPALGVAVVTGGLLDLDPARLRWRPEPGSAVAWSVPVDALAVDGSAGIPDLADGYADTVLAGPVRMLVEAAGRYGVSSQVLWGNVASVVHAVPGLIGAGDPELAGPAEALVAGVLDRPPLRGRFQGGGGAGFRRRSCCLVYRLVPGSAGPRAGSCGDCVLEPRAN